MKILVFLLSCFFSFPCFSSGQQPTKRHLYVEWRHWDSTIVLGELVGRKFKREIRLACPIQELKSADVSKWLGETGNEEVLLYFHAMWGQQVNFQRKCLRSIEKILDNQGDSAIQTVISFIWHAGGLSYSRNWQRASEKGEPLGDLIGWIGVHYSNKVNVLCHSMGNRFFEGTVRTAIEHYEKSTLLRTVILFSPDLDARVDDPDFLRLCQSTEEVVVFIHRRDRLLMISAWALGRERLGRSGPKGDIAAYSKLSHLLVVDMTGYVKGIQNHTHLNKKWVQQRIRNVLKP
ncbi:MAG TPA: alpha/beta hydrolase [Chryseolinea sp.]|nr:alpha/beta hydrolase [Chryseolinea sp.]